MVRRLIILFFIYSSAIRGQIISNNSYTGYFFFLEGGIFNNQLNTLSLEDKYIPPGKLWIHPSSKLSKAFFLGYKACTRRNFGFTAGISYDEASLRYQWDYFKNEYTNLGGPPYQYPYEYKRVSVNTNGYLIRRMLGLKAGILLRSKVLDFRVNMTLCKYFTYDYRTSHQHKEYNVIGSGVNFHTDNAYTQSGSVVITVPDDSLVTISKNENFTNYEVEVNSDNYYFHGYRINRPDFFDVPIEIALEKSILYKSFIFTLGARASVSHLLNSRIFNSGYYYGYGAYIGIGFGRTKALKKLKTTEEFKSEYEQKNTQ